MRLSPPKLLHGMQLRSVAKLAAGSLAAQSIGLLTVPVISRLYSPSEYAALAVFVSLAGVLGSVSTGAYDEAVVLPAEDEEGERQAAVLVGLSLTIAAVYATVLVPVVGMLGSLTAWAGEDIAQLGYLAYLIPLTVLFDATYRTLAAHAVRSRRYGALSRIPAMQRAVGAAVQVGAGLRGLGAAGLVLGVIVGQLPGVTTLARHFWASFRQLPSLPASRILASFRELARDYVDFPRVRLWVRVVSILAYSAPVLLVSRFYVPGEVGTFAMAYSLVGLMTGMLAASVTTVFSKEASVLALDSRHKLRSETKRMFAVSAFISIPSTIVMWVVFKYALPLLLGNEWRSVTVAAIALLPLFAARLATAPLLAVLGALRCQRALFLWHIALFGCALAIPVGAGAGLSMSTATLLYSGITAVCYLTLVPVAWRSMTR